MSEATTATLPRLAATTSEPPQTRFVLGWMLAWALIGTAVALGIAFGTGRELRPTLLISVLFAEVVGLTAFTSARLVFPLFVKLPFAVRLLLELLTVLSGAVFGSVAVFWIQPLYIAAQLRTVGLIVLVNAALAAVVGLALNTYDNLKRQLEESYRQLREKEALERELDIAREVQELLLPRAVPQFEGLQLAGVCRTAAGVGGDYFDFLPSGQQIGLVIADVSGKGFPAALLMAGLQASVRSMVRPLLEPANVNVRLNEHLCASSSPARYATLFIASYDSASRSLTYSNAGHLPPLLLRGGEVIRLDRGGMPIGLFESASFTDDRCELEAEDLLALFTDGVVETFSPAGEEFGDDRLIELLREYRDRDLEFIVHAVLRELEAWSGAAPPHDDVTLLLARVR